MSARRANRARIVPAESFSLSVGRSDCGIMRRRALLRKALIDWRGKLGASPVRGSTYFLCRRKESKQRKRAHTASACSYPRALNVPILRTATLCFALVACAPGKRPTCFVSRTTAGASKPSGPSCGKRYVGCRTADVRAQNFLAREARFAARKPTHRLPQMGICKRWRAPLKK